MTLDEIIDEQNKIHEELERMAADESTTEDADGGIRDTLVARWKGLDGDREKIVARMEELQLIRKASQDNASREPGDAGGGAAWSGGRGPEFMARRDPLAGREESHDYDFLTQPDAIARATSLVELHDRRGLMPGRGEAATRSAQTPSIARHMLRYGGDEYYEAFRDYVNDPTGPGMQRAAGALTLAAAQGGYLLPYFLDPTIVLTTDGTTNPYRRIANVKQITTNAYQGVNSAGVQAAFVDESGRRRHRQLPGCRPDQDLRQEGVAWVYGSIEANEDTNFADQLPRHDPGRQGHPRGDEVRGRHRRNPQRGRAEGRRRDARHRAAGQRRRVRCHRRRRRVQPGSGIGSAVPAGQLASGSSRTSPRSTRSGPRHRPAPGPRSGPRSATAPRPGCSTTASRRAPSVTSAAGTGTAPAGTASAQIVFGAWDNFYIVDRIGMSMLFDPMLKGTGHQPAPPRASRAGWRSGGQVRMWPRPTRSGGCSTPPAEESR